MSFYFSPGRTSGPIGYGYRHTGP